MVRGGHGPPVPVAALDRGGPPRTDRDNRPRRAVHSGYRVPARPPAITKGPATDASCAPVSIATLSLVLIAACTTASAGWTYVPAPSMTPIPSTAGSAEPSASGGDNVVQISALGIKYEQSSVTVKADTSFQIAFDNKDAGVPHNVSIHQGDATGAELFKGEIFNGVETRTYTVPPLDAGSYAFVCTVHPTMIGTLTAQ